MMAVIKDTIELVRQHHGNVIDLAHLPADDPDVYRALQQGDTVGWFQVESRAQMSSACREAASGALLRSRCTGSDYPAGSDRRQMASLLHSPASGKRAA